MTSLKTNIAQVVLMAFLVIFGFELTTVSLLSQIQKDLKMTEIPFDNEEEEEKSEKEKEFNHRLVKPVVDAPDLDRQILGIHTSDRHLYSIPREIVTPPPEAQS